MALLINVRQLERTNLRLAGELPAAELDVAGVDELVRVEAPLLYELEAQKAAEGVLVQGRLRARLECECARCLKPFQIRLDLKDWACLLPLEGEDQAVPVNDCVDLTPFFREDILLSFPQHPLCKPECGGLKPKAAARTKKPGGAGQNREVASAWAELNKLKFK